MTKKELRAKYKQLRNQLTDVQVSTMSLEIANSLITLPLWERDYFHIFLPISAMKEVDTEFILHVLAGKDKNIIISRSDFDLADMTHFLLTDNTRFMINDFGIPEPVDGVEVSESKIEVVFVPLLAFDINGQRVGYGKGFYDRFLSKCKPDTLKIGLSFFEAEAAFTEILENDVKLDFCVTPTKTYQF